MNLNNRCGGGHCQNAEGEVRWLPTGGDSNAILCRACFEHEMNYRRDRNRELAPECAYALPRWEDLKRNEP